MVAPSFVSKSTTAPRYDPPALPYPLLLLVATSGGSCGEVAQLAVRRPQLPSSFPVLLPHPPVGH